ncbi:MAG: hypothetical protein WCZ43_02740, partial [Proteiniphilum sp.]
LYQLLPLPKGCKLKNRRIPNGTYGWWERTDRELIPIFLLDWNVGYGANLAGGKSLHTQS